MVIAGSFIPQNHIRIGYEMARYSMERDEAARRRWDQLIIRETANAFNVNENALFDSNKDGEHQQQHISIGKRLSYLVRYSKQQNWNIDYSGFDGDGCQLHHDQQEEEEDDDEDDDGDSEQEESTESMTF